MRTQKQIREETAARRKAGVKGDYPPVSRDPDGNPLRPAPVPKPLPVVSEGGPRFKLNEGDCKFLGKRADGEPCGSGIYRCDNFGANTARFLKCPRVNHHCPTCPAFVVKPFAPLAGHFNASVFTWRGENYVVSRKGWTGSSLYLTVVGKEYQTVEGLSFPRVLSVSHDRSRAGREDPRFFTSRGMPFISYVGVELVAGRTKTTQLYARLDENLRVTQVMEPQLEGRKLLEKNWSFFDHGGRMKSVYSISPHVVLAHDGDRATREHEVDWFPPWTGRGHLRGGAPPVLVGGEYYHFFHGMNWRPGPTRHKEYCVGLYTFEAKPPFRPKRGPILVIDTPPPRPGWGVSCVFPAGAVYRGDHWLISYGLNDETFDVAKLDARELEIKLTDTRNAVFNSGLDPTAITALPGWCSAEKAMSCYDLVARGGVKTACEVGVFGGRWSVAVALALKRRNEGGKLYCVDPWDRSKDAYADPAYKKYWDGFDFKKPRAAFFEALDRLGLRDTVVIVEKDSRAGAADVPDRLDILHIDGSHDRDTSCHDATAYGAKVKRGGWIAFDDSHWPSTQDALSILAADCGLDRDYKTWRLYRKF